MESSSSDAPKGLKGRMGERARKAVSVVVVKGSHGRAPSVVLGGYDEEDVKIRERRRRAADGVLFWQREVGRLEDELRRSMRTESVGSTKGKRLLGRTH